MKQHDTTIFRQETGFSLVELMIYLAILGVMMTMVFSSFIDVTRISSHQLKVAETKIETGLGLDLLRQDIVHAGFGLPWEFPAGVVPNPYLEAPVGSPAIMNDVPNVPRAIISEDNSASSMNASDYLTIKATNVLRTASSQRWGWVGRDAAGGVSFQDMGPDALVAADRVIVLLPQPAAGSQRQLILFGGSYETRANAANLADYAPPQSPLDPDGPRYLVYGLDTNVLLRRPFNRTDYYINAPTPANPLPDHCAPNTGTLVKASMNQADDGFDIQPIMDCVADFQVVYHLDTDGDGGCDDADGIAGCDPSNANTLTAQQIRDQVKTIRCYILTHEGGEDRSYTRQGPNASFINVGEINPTLPINTDLDAAGVLIPVGAGVAGRRVDLNATIGGNWVNYHWKVYSLALTPQNLK